MLGSIGAGRLSPMVPSAATVAVSLDGMLPRRLIRVLNARTTTTVESSSAVRFLR